MEGKRTVVDVGVKRYSADTNEPILIGKLDGVRLELAEPVGIGEVVEVVARALEVFGDRTKALRWLRTPIPSLGDATPQEMLEREGGIEQVEDVLGRIEHGVW
jgi:putative toxin-antitoxin system antitoxin component (TIGR02293 family)